MRRSVLDQVEEAPAPRRRKFVSWAIEEPELAGFDASGVRAFLLDGTEPVDYDRRDDVLAALIRLSRSDDQAVGFLVRCLLPGLRSVLARHGWGIDREEADAVALAALCRRIRRYPLGRRTRRIAMNLLLDTTHDLVDARNAELAYRERVQLFARITVRDSEELPMLTPSVVWHEARRAGVLSEREVALIRTTYTYDLPVSVVAPLIGMTAEAAGKARRRAILKLRAWSEACEVAA